MRKSIPPTDARAALLSLTPPDIQLERVPLSAAFGRILAEDVVADIAIPPFDRSPVDGFAVRSADTAAASGENPVTLAITEEIPAGGVPTLDVFAGSAAKILTGAPIPRGADATVKYEQTAFTDVTVTLTEPLAAGENLVRAGEDVAIGEVVARCGDALSPASVALFASLGRSEVTVFRRPRVAVINTGSELVEPGNALPHGKIYNSGMYSLLGALAELGIDGYDAGIVRDDPDAIAAALESALPQCDALITTGGASVGDYDFSVEAAQRLGAEVLFWKAKMKPGGAMVASHVGGKLILALSGNPGAALIGLLYIAKPFLLRLAGRRDVEPKAITVRLREPYATASPRTRLLRGSLEIVDGTAYFVQRGAQGGSALANLAYCNLLAEIPAGSPPLDAGALIQAYEI